MLNQTIRKVNKQVAAEVLQKPVDKVDAKVRLTLSEKVIMYIRIAKKEFHSFIFKIREKYRQSIQDGEQMAVQSILPDPEIKVLKAQGYSSIPRGCSIWEYNTTTRVLRKAPIEEVEVTDERGKAVRKCVMQEEGCQYFYALNEKTAKEKVGL